MYLVKQTGEHELVIPYQYNTLPIPRFSVQTNRDVDAHLGLTGNRRTKHRNNYVSIPLFLDTETSHNEDNTEGWIHQWACCWNHRFVVGRRISEIVKLFDHLDKIAELNRIVRHQKANIPFIVVYVHNLSYDLPYMEKFLPGLTVFATAAHKPLYARYKHVELRCSYRLTNKSLAKWASDSGSLYPKLADYDYSTIRTPDDSLTDSEWAYQLNDVAAMESAWNNDRAQDGYIMAALPLTSTGFVRTDCRLRAYAVNYIPKRKYMAPTYEQYLAEQAAFQGGYTHGNRFLKNKTITSPNGIGHRDFRSRYPSTQMMSKFPAGKWEESENLTLENVDRLIRRGRCVLFRVRLQDVALKDRRITAPYLGLSKLENISFTGSLLDNGRIIYFDGTAETWLTNYDYKWLDKQYTLKAEVLTLYHCVAALLPKWYRDTIMKYYYDKTTKKELDPATVQIAKARLNGIYGMSAQKAIQPTTEYSDGLYAPGLFDPEKQFDKYTKSEKTFSLYSWGVFTTAASRDELMTCIELIGYDNFIYCDTDSIFYFITNENEQAIADYNRRITKQAVEMGASVNWKGKDYPLGEFTPESDMPVQKFRFIHSKCYSLIDKNGKLSVTIAGVNKVNKEKGITNAQELGTIDNLYPGFIFRSCGGHRIEYIISEPHQITVNGCTIDVGDSAIIIPTEYEINDKGLLDYDDAAQLAQLVHQYSIDNDGIWIMQGDPKGGL